MTRRKRHIIFIVVVVLLAGAGLIVWVGHQVLQVPRDAYAVWWTADLVIEHMERHGGSWPRSWDELRTTSDQAYKGITSTNRDGTMLAEFRPRDAIDELRQRVDIDWQADPTTLAKTEFKQTGPPFRVIWLRNGKPTHYSGKEPNNMVLEYLKWKEKETNVIKPDDAANRSQWIRAGTNRTSVAAASDH